MSIAGGANIADVARGVAGGGAATGGGIAPGDGACVVVGVGELPLRGEVEPRNGHRFRRGLGDLGGASLERLRRNKLSILTVCALSIFWRLLFRRYFKDKVVSIKRPTSHLAAEKKQLPLL